LIGDEFGLKEMKRPIKNSSSDGTSLRQVPAKILRTTWFDVEEKKEIWDYGGERSFWKCMGSAARRHSLI
jgi:hypothetical protein